MPSFNAPPSTPVAELEPEVLAVARINILEKLLQREMELHQATKCVLTQSRAYCKVWEHAHADAQSELHYVQVQLSAVEQAAREVLMENYELKRAIHNIVRPTHQEPARDCILISLKNSYRPVTPISSDCDEEAVKEHRDEPPSSTTGEIPITVGLHQYKK